MISRKTPPHAKPQAGHDHKQKVGGKKKKKRKGKKEKKTYEDGFRASASVDLVPVDAVEAVVDDWPLALPSEFANRSWPMVPALATSMLSVASKRRIGKPSVDFFSGVPAV